MHDVAVGELARGDALALGHLRDRLAVLVRAGEEEHVLAALAHVAGQHVGGDRRVRVAEVGLRVHVVDRRGDVGQPHSVRSPRPAPPLTPRRGARQSPPRRATRAPPEPSRGSPGMRRRVASAEPDGAAWPRADPTAASSEAPRRPRPPRVGRPRGGPGGARPRSRPASSRWSRAPRGGPTGRGGPRPPPDATPPPASLWPRRAAHGGRPSPDHVDVERRVQPDRAQDHGVEAVDRRADPRGWRRCSPRSPGGSGARARDRTASRSKPCTPGGTEQGGLQHLHERARYAAERDRRPPAAALHRPPDVAGPPREGPGAGWYETRPRAGRGAHHAGRGGDGEALGVRRGERFARGCRLADARRLDHVGRLSARGDPDPHGRERMGQQVRPPPPSRRARSRAR